MTVRSPSRTMTTFDALLNSLVSALDDEEAAEGAAGAGAAATSAANAEQERKRRFMTRESFPMRGGGRSAPQQRQDGGVGPREPAAGQNAIEDGHERRAQGQRPDDAVGAEQAELDVPGDEGDQRAEEHARRPDVRRRPRIRDHEEGEEQQAAALEAAHRDGHRLAQVERAAEQQRRVDDDEGAARRRERSGAVGDQAAQARHQEGEERDAAPLRRRQPRRRRVSSISTMAPLVGLKTCFFPTWRTNLLAIATKAAAAATQSVSMRSSRHSDSAEIRALRGSNAGSFQRRVQAHCVRSATARVSGNLPAP